MPTYEYQCAKCGHEMEAFQSMKDLPIKKCPACKRNVLKRKVGGGAGLIFKGSGFYITDYRKKPMETKKESADTKPATAPAAPSTKAPAPAVAAG
jgi:putative FmdB family regulatory protein